MIEKILHKGRLCSTTDVLSDIEWDIEHGDRDTARQELLDLAIAAWNNDDELLRYECTRLHGLLERGLPPRSDKAQMPAASPANQPPPQPENLTSDDEKQLLREAILEIIGMYEKTNKTVSSGPFWKVVFRVCQDIELSASKGNAYAEFEALAHELELDNPDVCHIPFKKDNIKDITSETYKRYLDHISKWTTSGLEGKRLALAKDMIAAKNLLLERLMEKGVC